MAKAGPGPIWSNPYIVLFHGTTANNVASILAAVSLNHGIAYRDFGPGFYTTTSELQATRWANLKAARFNQQAAVIRFEVDRDYLAQLAFMAFVRKDIRATDFWDFIHYCRLGSNGHSRGGQSMWYDVVVGPVVKRWGRRKVAFRDYDQISFHTQTAINILNASTRSQIP